MIKTVDYSKRKIGTVVVVVAVFLICVYVPLSVLFAQTGNDCDNPYELVVGADAQLHDLHQLNDADYFRVFLEAGKTYRVIAEYDPDMDGNGTDLNLALVPEDECIAGGFRTKSKQTKSELRFTVLETGYYILRTKQNDNNYGSDTDYTVYIEEFDESEPNDSCSEATVLIPDDPAQQHLLPDEDTDWFRFTVRSGYEYTVTVSPDVDSNLDLYFELWPACVDDYSVFDTLTSPQFTAHSNGVYVVQLVNVNEEPETDNVTYEIQVTTNIDPVTDTDGDALPDYFEINGWDFDEDGVVDVDLPAMGADPNVPDIFVEIDYMEHSQQSYQPDPESIRIVVDSFAEQGIHLHVDYGPESPLTWGDTPIWGQLSGANQLPYKPYFGHCNSGGLAWNKFDQDKLQYFAPERKAIFHYAQWGHRLCRENRIIMSGLSRNIPYPPQAIQNGASDLIVALGVWLDADQELPVDSVAGLFMHELGHNLGLMHGGDDNFNLKPNHLSVMNYAYTQQGLYTNENGSPSWGKYTYSKYKVTDLDPSSLDESIGLNIDMGVQHNLAGLIYICPDDTVRLSDGVNAIDWDCNGDTAGSDLSLDLHASFPASQDTILTSYQEWDNLVFDGGWVGTFVPENNGGFSVNSLPSISPTDFSANTFNDIREFLGLPSLDPVKPPPPVEQTLVVGTAVIDISYPYCRNDVTYQADGLPPGVEIDVNTGDFSGEPEQSGTFTATIIISGAVSGDGDPLFELMVFTVEGDLTESPWSPLSIRSANNSVTLSSGSSWLLVLGGLFTLVVAGVGILTQRPHQS